MGRLIDAKKLSNAYMIKAKDKLRLSTVINEVELQPTIDPIHYAGGCYCRECRFADECIKRIEFMGRNPVLELNTYEYHPLQWCSYGCRREGGE